jgi:hypothetical protein
MRFTILSLAFFLSLLPRLTALEATLERDVSFSSVPNASRPDGNAPLLRISDTDTTFLYFDIQSVLPDGTTSSQVAKATLRIWLSRIDQPGWCSVSRVTNNWDETSLTLNNSIVGESIASRGADRAKRFLVFDITELVRSWLDGSANFGVALRGVPLPFVKLPALNARIDSKENTATGHLPTLQIALAAPKSSGTIFPP